MLISYKEKTMLQQLTKALQNALAGIAHKQTKIQLSELDFQLSLGLNRIKIGRGSYDFKVKVDDETVRGGYRNQTCTASLFDCEAAEYSDKFIKITTRGRQTTVWVRVSEKENTYSDLKEIKPTHTPEDIERAKTNFLAVYSKVKSYLDCPQIDALQANLAGLVKLSSACTKLNKLGIKEVQGLEIEEIQKLSYDSEEREKALKLLKMHEEIVLSRKRPLADFPYIQRKHYPETELNQFGLYGSCTGFAGGGLENVLAVPLYSVSGGLTGYQTIASNGQKLYWVLNGLKSKSFAVVGALEDVGAQEHLTLCEGFATGVSLKLIFPERNILITLDTNGLKQSTKTFADRKLTHALDNDSRGFAEKHKRNAGIEASLSIEHTLRLEGIAPQIDRICVAPPVGFTGFQIDFDDLRKHFKNDFIAIRNHLQETKFSFNPITLDFLGKENYFVHARHLTPDFLPPEEKYTFSSNSPTGTGKSTFLRPAIKSAKNALYICMRRSIVAEFCETNRMFYYEDAGVKGAFAAFNNKMATTIHSLPKLLKEESFKEFFADLDLVIIDEFDQVLTAINNNSDKDAIERINALVHVAKNAKRLVNLSATLAPDSLEFIKDLRPDAPYTHLYNTCTPNRGFIQMIDPKEKGVFEKLIAPAIAGLNAGERLAITSDGAKSLRGQFEKIKLNFPDKRVLCCTADGYETSWGAPDSVRRDFLANADNYLKENKIDIFMYSPTIQTGVSINLAFSKQFCEFSQSNITPSSQMQQVMRLRHVGARYAQCVDYKAANAPQSLENYLFNKKQECFNGLLNLNATLSKMKLRPDAPQNAYQEVLGFAKQTTDSLLKHFDLSDSDKLGFISQWEDRKICANYLASFERACALNGMQPVGLDISTLSEKELDTPTPTLSKKEKSQLEQFLDPDDALKTILNQTLTAPLAELKYSAQKAEKTLSLDPDTPVLVDDLEKQKLGIFLDKEKYIARARRFSDFYLTQEDGNLELEVLKKDINPSRSSAGAIGKTLAQRPYVLELIRILKEENEAVLEEFVKKGRAKKIIRNNRSTHINVWIDLFGLSKLKNKKIDPEYIATLCNHILRPLGLSVEKVKSNYFEFWINFAKSIKSDYLFDLKQDNDSIIYPKISLSDREVCEEKKSVNYRKNNIKDVFFQKPNSYSDGGVDDFSSSKFGIPNFAQNSDEKNEDSDIKTEDILRDLMKELRPSDADQELYFS